MVVRSLRWILFVLAVVTLLIHTAHLQPWTLDDAYISFRYAENFAQGAGIVYNSGERVEGYTTFLWVFLLGLGRMAGCDIVVLAKVLGLALSIGCLLLLFTSHRFTSEANRRVAMIGPILLGTCGIFTAWAMTGMEVPLVGFLVLLAALLHMKSRVTPEKTGLVLTTGLTCALATMSRPECGLLFLVLFADRFVDSIKRRNLGFFWFGLAFTCVYLPYFIWRYLYYGYLLPNTFYAKVGYTQAQVMRGLHYTMDFAGPAFLILVPMIAGLMYTSDTTDKSRRPGSAALAWAVVVHTVYVVLVGGDTMPAYRFYAPFMPLICLLASMSLAVFIKSPVRLAVVLTILVAYNATQTRVHEELRGRPGQGNVSRYGKEIGLWMRDNLPADALIATNTAGSIPYYSKLRTIDMLGLNDATIAHRKMARMGRGKAGHEKGDGAYVLSRRPDYIQFGSSRGRRNPSFVGDKEIYRHPDFKKFYQLRTFRMPSGATLYLYERTQPE